METSLEGIRIRNRTRKQLRMTNNAAGFFAIATIIMCMSCAISSKISPFYILIPLSLSFVLSIISSRLLKRLIAECKGTKYCL